MAALHRQVEESESAAELDINPRLNLATFVVRNGFSMDLANLLLDDLRLHLRVLEHNPQKQMPPELQAKRESFKH